MEGDCHELSCFMTSTVSSTNSTQPSNVDVSAQENLASNSSSSRISEASRTLNESDSGVFERWQRAFSDMTGVGLTAEQKADRLAVHQQRLCEKWKNELVNYS